MNRRIRFTIAALAGMLAALLFVRGASTEPAPQHARPGFARSAVRYAKPGEPHATGFNEGRLAMAVNPSDNNWMSTGVQQRATPATTPSRTPGQRSGPGAPTQTAAPARTATPTKARSTASTPTSQPAPAPAQSPVATPTAIIIDILPVTGGLGPFPSIGSQSDWRALALALALAIACLLLGLGLALRLASTRRTR
ncbi:MAG TPA: hypothetical protein VF914_05990 [Chloroflexia bacterium]|jgi:hypothetical protein